MIKLIRVCQDAWLINNIHLYTSQMHNGDLSLVSVKNYSKISKTSEYV